MKRFLKLMISFSLLLGNICSVSALEKSYETNKILEIAYNGKAVSTIQQEEVIPLTVIYDSRDDSLMTASASYDYYKTYSTGVTCKGTGAAGSYLLDANITFYINVYYNLDSNNKSVVVKHDAPVVKRVYGVYGATGYSNPKVTVTSYTNTSMKFKGTCTLTAGGTYKMTGTKTISLP